MPQTNFRHVDGLRRVASFASPLSDIACGICLDGDHLAIATNERVANGRWEEGRVHVVRLVRGAAECVIGLKRVASMSGPIGGTVRTLFDLGDGLVLAQHDKWKSVGLQEARVLRVTGDADGTVTGIAEVASITEALADWRKTTEQLGAGYVLARQRRGAAGRLFRLFLDDPKITPRVEADLHLKDLLGGKSPFPFDLLDDGDAIVETADGRRVVAAFDVRDDDSRKLLGSMRHSNIGGIPFWKICAHVDLGEWLLLAGTLDGEVVLLKPEVDTTGRVVGVAPTASHSISLAGRIQSLLPMGNRYVLAWTSQSSARTSDLHLVRVLPGAQGTPGHVTKVKRLLGLVPVSLQLNGLAGDLFDVGNGNLLVHVIQRNEDVFHSVKVDGKA